ncbi:TIM-barrel domain-containing protein [Accumulibacter sp.]|uniref:glycoside hydrolase family 31 protein n=5 Tax=Accumulibacter sp. TaxID=2053492 RepID=UPI002878E0D5|nr:TIM-barrel domain-containing protein [Accumulibacter sp.]MDS4055404.1 glycoside hydrolase family 31 protein [Accumulibacter sp.]HNB68312.1 glycoside hydrolase family 31 protein [Accumulibacter sp.]HNC26994.1 glycoside hydrolase family 31 protein [Accumulibacter sp.]HND39189.1 glycoside hydrolase family 31 protein [Accumulibacter sp.]
MPPTTNSIYPTHLPGDPQADPAAIVTHGAARFTLLTARLVRLEYAPAGGFEDRASRSFVHRRLAVPAFTSQRVGTRLEIVGEHLRIDYDERHGFTAAGLSITLANGCTWRYGDADDANLGGTLRTLDKADGPVALEPGLLSRAGWSLVDDSASPLLDGGWIAPRRPGAPALDLYFFAYGQDYAACLRDFRTLSGQVPLLPRWALGNWWSRYWAYRQDELLALMRDFAAHRIPLAVCVIDMDWHITHTGNASRGWTGYTWNRELFPDPRQLLAELHALGLKIALNLHPADGVWPHEAAYADFARALGQDPASGAPIAFALSDRVFAQAYFTLLHHPHEAAGVDFWWIDWQQGRRTPRCAIDPLWWLNHLHFHDLARDGWRRPFTFSRWGGLGGQRYPIGFSGDTVISWRSLAFQPYFTATAANVAAGWWSHDIGGHMEGIDDAELYLRWVQFGVFSPILRLHSTQNPYLERRPWGRDSETLRHARAALQLRHALIPYLYSMAWRDHAAGCALVTPLYHAYPDAAPAYACPAQYLFGSELLVAPHCAPRAADTQLSRQVVWLPPGDWYDFFTGEYYPGDAWHSLYGELAEIPVFARAGAIVPLADAGSAFSADVDTDTDGDRKPDAAPPRLVVHIFPGADNRFELYEDDGESNAYLAGASALTPIQQRSSASALHLLIGPTFGDCSVVPPARAWTLVLHARAAPTQIVAEIDGQACPFETQYDADSGALHLILPPFAPQARCSVVLSPPPEVRRSEDLRARLARLIAAFRCASEAKRALAVRLDEIVADFTILGAYRTALSDGQLRAMLETLTGAGLHQTQASGENLRIVWNRHADARLTLRWSIENRTTWDPYRRYRQEAGPAPRFAEYRPLTHPGAWQLSLHYGTLLAVSEREPADPTAAGEV